MNLPRPSLASWSMIVLCMMLASGWPTSAHAQACGAIYGIGHYGPYDYRTEREQLVVVDKFHFGPQVEGLVSGMSTYIGGDLNYVLLSAPNHHRALVAMTRLADRTKRAQPEGADFSISCYYDRAVRFAPDDVIVRALYAQFLAKQGRKPEAIQQLDAAVIFAKEDAFSHYNIGLVYFELGAYEPALSEAWKAQSLGFERTELAAMLKRAGKWREPPAGGVAPASSASKPAATLPPVDAAASSAAAR